MFSLLGNEFTFDVDISRVGCGLNAALNFLVSDESAQGPSIDSRRLLPRLDVFNATFAPLDSPQLTINS
jgi:hypothetical protein